MSATKQIRRFPTEAELDSTIASISRAYAEVEKKTSWPVKGIIRAYEEDGAIVDRPSFETIGLLADWIDHAQTAVDQLGCEIDELRQALHGVMMLREAVAS